ncbi:hypothetical protein OG21DRAFT_221036 [Imleria badia]|nr:hypothetical protein OG21DRAFT_221036 [Imleria badia]
MCKASDIAPHPETRLIDGSSRFLSTLLRVPPTPETTAHVLAQGGALSIPRETAIHDRNSLPPSRNPDHFSATHGDTEPPIAPSDTLRRVESHNCNPNRRAQCPVLPPSLRPHHLMPTNQTLTPEPRNRPQTLPRTVSNPHCRWGSPTRSPRRAIRWT